MDPGDLMELIESLASVVDLSSGNDMRDTDEISGFCPHKKTLWFSKLTSIWRDPFKIKENVSEIDCCGNGQPQIVHCKHNGHFDKHYVEYRQAMT